jgi:hypothetical protein
MSGVAHHPPPWRLTGRGCVVAMRFSEGFLREKSALPESLRGSLRSAVSWCVFVDYTTADCGPYHELLFIPGTCQFSGQRLLTISKIYVSSEASVVNGRRNWGIPKERCEFNVSRNEDGADCVRLALDGRPVAHLVFRSIGPRLPMVIHLLPRRWRTLGQRAENRDFVYMPEARGKFRFAQLQRLWTDPELFPDLRAGKVLGCFAVPEFRMVFPEAQARPPWRQF